jgi:transposase
MKGAIKIHTVLDYDSCLPVFIRMTDGKTSDIEIAEKLAFPKGSILAIDRGYLDFNFLHNLDSTGVFFVTRAKSNIDYDIVKLLALPKESENIVSDYQIELVGQQTKDKYKKRLRLVKVTDPETGEIIPLLTNNFFWTSKTISELYRNRWEIETFFRMVKQNLKIKSFIGTSENAVLIQIWSALITILLLSVLKAKALYKWHMSNMVGFIRLNLFVKIDLFEWLNQPFLQDNAPPGQMQLDLF